METQISSIKPPEMQRTNFLAVFGCMTRVIMLFFVVIGSVFFVGFGVWPTIQWWRSQSWVPASCNIQSVEIVSRNVGDEGISYVPKIAYIYRWKQRDYQGNQLDFDSRSYSKKEWLEEKLKPFAPGTETKCFVNPTLPQQSSLTRDFPAMSLLFSLIGLLFVSIGVIVFRFNTKAKAAIAGKLDESIAPAGTIHAKSIFEAAEITSGESNKSSSRGTQVAVSSVVPLETEGENQPQIIKPEISRWSMVFGLMIFGIIWNGIIGVVLFLMLREPGGISIFMSLFLIPFVLIGLVIVLLFFRQVLVLANPQPTVVYSDSWIYPGSEFEVSWMMKGKVSRIKTLSIFIEGIEAVTYQQGTSTRNESNVFYRQKIIEIEQQSRIAQGFEVARIPDDTMHTFAASNNKIQWQVRFEGEIPWWPNLSEKFPLVILPPKPQQELL